MAAAKLRPVLTQCGPSTIPRPGCLLTSWHPHSEVNGQVAEWLRSGLQSREHRFESGPGLHRPCCLPIRATLLTSVSRDLHMFLSVQIHAPCTAENFSIFCERDLHSAYCPHLTTELKNWSREQVVVG